MNSEQALKYASKIHALIHAVRLIDGYKPSMMDKKVSAYTLEFFSAECEECKTVHDSIKNKPVEKDGFLDKLKGALE